MPSEKLIDAMDLTAIFETSISDHWRLFQTEGIALIVLGLAAMTVVLLTGPGGTTILGGLLLISGAVGLFSAFEAQRAPGFGWSLLSAGLALLAGGIVLWNPWPGPLTLSDVLVAFFNVDGILLIMLALQLRNEATARWQWIMISGVVDVVLAEIIIAAVPSAATWVLGVVVGADFLCAGASLIAMAGAARNAGDAIRPVVARELVRPARVPAHCLMP